MRGTRDLFTGVSAFPLSPLLGGELDAVALSTLVRRAANSGATTITVLGSTGSYMYLNRAERERVVELAVQHAGGVPVLAGVGALSTREVLHHVEVAERVGAEGLLLAPVSYQPLSEHEVFELFREVSDASNLPIVIYDNPGTTGFHFSLDLYSRIASLPMVASIKVPPISGGIREAQHHLKRIRAVIPDHVTVGISGDAVAVTAVEAGFDAWYSVVAGTLPEAAMSMYRDAEFRAGQSQSQIQKSSEPCGSITVDSGPRETRRSELQILGLRKLFELFGEFGGSLRVIAAVAEQLGLVAHDCLPRPLLGLAPGQRARINQVLTEYSLAQ